VDSFALDPVLAFARGRGTSGGELDRTDRLFLRRVARRTWRYFDDLVNADSNWLPPDNTQLALRVEVARGPRPPTSDCTSGGSGGCRFDISPAMTF